jgi:2-keto-3-deoxy-6-phosphogluconate aldolase
MTIIERMGKTPLIPVCVIEDAATALPAAQAMLPGGALMRAEFSAIIAAPQAESRLIDSHLLKSTNIS